MNSRMTKGPKSFEKARQMLTKIERFLAIKGYNGALTKEWVEILDDYRYAEFSKKIELGVSRSRCSYDDGCLFVALTMMTYKGYVPLNYFVKADRSSIVTMWRIIHTAFSAINFLFTQSQINAILCSRDCSSTPYPDTG